MIRFYISAFIIFCFYLPCETAHYVFTCIAVSMYFICALCVTYFFNEISSEYVKPEVTTPLGIVKGYYDQSHSGRIYKVFEGIPYAEPPIGIKRFKPPEKLRKWDNIIHSTKPAPPCIQYRPQTGVHEANLRGQEDCLYLNIYVPNNNENQSLPVIFAIHGGCFQFGNALCNPGFMMDRDIIVVTVGYRLGILGFISTGDHHIPGNMGLKDQSMALRWTFENIQYFSGDPKRITLIGNSAGAQSVHLHYLSPLSKGLFQNGISFSGSSFTAGSMQKRSLDKFKKLATILNCPTESILETVECLRTKSAEEITMAIKHFSVWYFISMIPFGPVVEKGAHEPFIDHLPIEIINKGHVADVLWINGVVSDEGLSLGEAYLNEPTRLSELNEDWNDISPHLLMYNFTMPIKKHEYHSNLIRNQYFGKQNISKNTMKTLLSLLSDRHIYSSTIRAAKLQAKVNRNSVLVWYYNYRASTSCSDFYLKKPEKLGVCHGDDMFLMYGNSVIDPMVSEKDRAVQMKLLDLLVSVAAKGYPDIGVKWNKVNSDTEELELLNFSSLDDIKMESRSNFGEHKFWDAISDYENLSEEEQYLDFNVT